MKKMVLFPQIIEGDRWHKGDAQNLSGVKASSMEGSDSQQPFASHMWTVISVNPWLSSCVVSIFVSFSRKDILLNRTSKYSELQERKKRGSNSSANQSGASSDPFRGPDETAAHDASKRMMTTLTVYRFHTVSLPWIWKLPSLLLATTTECTAHLSCHLGDLTSEKKPAETLQGQFL